jgi:hypothetical protein
MESAAAILHDLGLVAHGGPLLLFAILLPLAGRLRGLEPWTLDRCWRAWAPASGLALGVLILGGLARVWLLHGSFDWGVEHPHGPLTLAKHVIFLLFWVNYTYTEIWVAEPLRRLDTLTGPPADLPAYLSARRRVIRQLWLSAVALVVMLVLSCLQV